jgi:hypothetical protein
MFKDLFDFKKTRTAKEAIIFYAFYTAAILAITHVFGS